MSGNYDHKGGGGGRRLTAKTILNFYFDYLNPSLNQSAVSLSLVENYWASSSSKQKERFKMSVLLVLIEKGFKM